MTQTKDRKTRKDPTVAFRVTPDRKHLIKAAAARRHEIPSEWLRRAVEAQLRRELGELSR